MYRGDGAYSRVPPVAGVRARGILTLSAGVFLLYQGLTYSNFALYQRSEKVLHAQLRSSPYDI